MITTASAIGVAQAPDPGADLPSYVDGVCRAACTAARELARTDTATKNRALEAIATQLLKRHAEIACANAEDMRAAREHGLNEALLDRLELTPKRQESMVQGVREIAALPDPIGEILELRRRPSGIQVGRMRVPLGVIGVIYESRPGVTVDAAALCLKSGNAVILRGGTESLRSNLAIGRCLHAGLAEVDLPLMAVTVIADPDRAIVGELLRAQDGIDVLVPRGGRSLIEKVSSEARMPVLRHLDGICHVYVDAGADLDKAEAVAYNAKTQRYATCNTMECLLVAEAVAAKLLPRLGRRFLEARVELRGCERTCTLLPEAVPATEQDYATEFLSPILAVRVVADLDEALAHIERFGSAHTDAIITENLDRALRFLREVDSSSVLVNASTRFADGCEYGLGAELGISTDKLHARGPVGLESLTSQKFVVLGTGQVRT